MHDMTRPLPNFSAVPAPPAPVLDDRIFINQRNRMLRILLDDISYVVAERAYCTIVMATGERYTLSVSLGRLERQLPAGRLLRIHRSYIVHPAAITVIEGGAVLVGERYLPVSKPHRAALLGGVRTIS